MTLFDLAQRFVGEIREQAGPIHHPFIQWSFTTCGYGLQTPDETPWCSSFLNGLCWLLRLPRSKSARARSWLTVGRPISLEDAQPGDVVVLKRGDGEQPGADVLDAPGHTGLYAGTEGVHVLILGGNQSDGVTIGRWPRALILGIRRVTA